VTLVSKLNVVIEVIIITTGTFLMGGTGNVVGIATAYGWTVRRSNLGGGEIFRTCPDRP
jgi:hypothetical protein